ncbi:MAG: hypothetical protein U0324_07055 [Polyangiales bacterium]
MTQTPPPEDDALVVERARRRLRALRALRGAVEFALWGAALAVLALLAARLGMLPARRAKAAFAFALAIPLVGALAAALRRVPALLAAQLLDRHYGLHDRLSSALEFRARPAAERTPWMEAAIADAAETVRTRTIDPRPALRWVWPDEARAVAGMLVLLALVAAAEFRVARVVEAPRPTRPAVADPLVLEDDDLAAFRELSRELERNARTAASRDALRDFGRFLDDVESRRLERQDAYRRLAALQQRLDAARREDQEARRAALAEVGQRLESELTRDVSSALRQGDTERARDAMRQLAERMRGDQRMSDQQRRDLQRALQQAGEQRDRDELRRQVEQARRDVEQMLQRQRERQLTRNEQDVLRQRQRQQELLQRESEQQQSARREVERLQRELSQAAQDLMRDLGVSAQDLERGAEELSRMQDEQQSQQSMEELRQRLQELREQMRQQNGQNGQQQRARLARFFRSAGGRAGGQRGQQGQQGQQQGQGQQGQGQQGQGQAGRQGQQGQQGGGQGQGGMGMEQGQGGQPGGQTLVLRPGTGGSISVPMGGTGGQQGSGQQGGQGQQGPQGNGAGVGHEENARGAAVDAARATQTVQVHGQQTGNGPSRSQVIRTAAADGFASAPYRQVYSPYWDRAREALHQGEVPAGYRSYVRRYFQLIRPRDEQ